MDWLDTLLPKSGFARPSDDVLVQERGANEIFENPRFQRCLKNQSETMVLEGDLGVGKTTTLNRLIRKTLNIHSSAIKHQPNFERSNVADNSSHEQRTAALHAEGYTVPRSGSSPEQGHDQRTSDHEHSVYGSNDQAVVVASVFFQVEAQEPHDTVQVLIWLLKSLVLQIPRGRRHVQDLSRQQGGSGSPEIGEVSDEKLSISSTIVSVIRKAGPVCIFLDALDQCSKESLHKILKCLKDVQTVTRIGIVMTDQVEHSAWRAHFLGTCAFELKEQDEDMRAYLNIRFAQRTEIEPSRYSWLDVQTRKNAIDKIMRCSINMLVYTSYNVWTTLTS
jgi:hypothetical protein